LLPERKTMLPGGESEARQFATHHSSIFAACLKDAGDGMVKSARAFRFERAQQVLHSLQESTAQTGLPATSKSPQVNATAAAPVSAPAWQNC